MASLVSIGYDYFLLLLSLILAFLETIATGLTLLLPNYVLDTISNTLRRLLPRSAEQRQVEDDKPLFERIKKVANARSFIDLCNLHGYQATEHIVATPDGYMLGIHRIAPKTSNSSQGVVYLHHGLLMNSEIWVANIHSEDSIAFRLADAGYEVWLGNNRGNKYSRKHISKHPNSREFWNFCIDEFAMYDIPATVDYILRFTKKKSLTYIGFSQGSAQAFAALSIHPELNHKINLFIALGPAMAPPSVGPRILHALITASPSILFLLFGHRAILRSTLFWQRVMLPEVFIRMIDMSNRVLFRWHSKHISWKQKRASYSHLYSHASVKCVVHWFQIIAKNDGIHMFDDDNFGLLGSLLGTPGSKYYEVPPFPTKNISTPIEIIYGTADTLIDIDALLDKLPPPAGVHPIKSYEHLEMIWGEKVGTVITPLIERILKKHSEKETASIDKAVESSDGKLLAISPPRVARPFLDIQPPQYAYRHDGSVDTSDISP